MLPNWLVVGMTIFPHPAKPSPPLFAPHGFVPPHKGGRVGMGQDFSPVPQTW